MPQMAPLNWMTLMMTFILIMLMFNILNYYSFTKNSNQEKTHSIKIQIKNWKW